MLIVLQGIDTAGKDGAIGHVMSAFNPQGCTVTGFKAPTPDELAHDYLWRVHRVTPAHGTIGIFNRSHYEDVLVVRVHELVPRAVWKRRYAEIDAFEQLLADSGTTIIKFFLHISPEEQRSRLQARLDDPTKRWKFQKGDLAERKLWPRIPGGLRGRAVTLLHQGRALVHHPGRPQVVPRPGRRRDRGPDPGRPETALPRRLPRPGGPQGRVTSARPGRGGAVAWEKRPSHAYVAPRCEGAGAPVSEQNRPEGAGGSVARPAQRASVTVSEQIRAQGRTSATRRAVQGRFVHCQRPSAALGGRRRIRRRLRRQRVHCG